jgi:glycosyltransferase involved in cell wall biosynthesis
MANSWLSKRETKRDLHARFQKQSFLLALHPWFRWADVIHYHIVHDQWFSLDAMPFLTDRKPTVWTWHDPWMMTGHCIYPIECQRWRIGCGACPALGRPFAMKEDRSADQFAYKRDLMRRTKAHIVLASEYMTEMARASPIAEGRTLHTLPFGIDLEAFKPGGEAAARKRLGIQPEHLVISFRGATENIFKGVTPLLQAIQRLSASLPPLCLLVTHGRGIAVHRFGSIHHVIELGWVDDNRTLIDSYLAADIVVIPSVAEAFGMMAIEAMACGTPVIVGDGTSLPAVTGAPEIGLAVDAGDPDALAFAITKLATEPAERLRRGAASRKFAEKFYGLPRYAASLARIYRAAAAERP